MTNDLPDVRERDGGPRPAPPAGGPRLSDVWVYNGRAYDLSEWISKHPGGAFFIGRTKNRDITAIVKSYHRDPAIVERILQRRYALGRDATPRDITPSTMHRHFCSKTTSTAGGTPRSIDSTTPTICCTGSKRG